MGDEAVLLARQVAMAASAWLHAKADTEAYRRMVAAVGAWDAYSAPKLSGALEDEVAARLRRAARRALHMDAEATRRAGRVAATASAWLHAPNDADPYRHFADATSDWDNYAAPRLEESTEELLDLLADDSAPVALSEIVADVTAQIHQSGPRSLTAPPATS